MGDLPYIKKPCSPCPWRVDADHPSSERWVRNVEKIRAALDAVGADYDYDKILTNQRKKVGAQAKY